MVEGGGLVLWVRHAESVANAGGRTSQAPEIALTERGRLAAAAFADKLQFEPDCIVCSKYLRACETARPIQVRFRAARQFVAEIHEFDYLDSRRCENTTANERRGMVEEYWQRGDPSYVDGGGSESFHQFRARIASALQTIAALPFNRAIVVTHEQVMQMVRSGIALGFENVSMTVFRRTLLDKTVKNANLGVMVTRVNAAGVWRLA